MSIPVDRILAKEDELTGADDYAGAERLLDYWISSALAEGDDRGRLTMYNEQIGLFRKILQKEKGLTAVTSALELSAALGLEDTVTFGTTLVNAATAYKAFDMAEDALPLYEKARGLYERLLSPSDGRLGGLYNNMALTLMGLGRLDEARAMFMQALHIMEQQENGELECAITYCNLADLAAAEVKSISASADSAANEVASDDVIDEAPEEPMDEERLLAAGEEIGACLEKAYGLLLTPTLPRDGYFRFVCSKCAPTFGCYGFLEYEKEIRNLG